MNWGSRLKAARKRRGFTQEDLAEKLHLTKSCISKYENDNKEIRISTFQEWFKHTNAQDLMIATMLAVDPAHVSQILEGINQLGQFVGMILIF